MNNDSHIELFNNIDLAGKSVTFVIKEEKTGARVQLTASDEGSVTHPCNSANGPWYVTASVDGEAGSAVQVTAAGKVSAVPAVVEMTLDFIAGHLNIASEPEAGRKPASRNRSGEQWSPIGGPTLGASKSLGFSMQTQTQTNWCWAATAVSVAKFYDASAAYTQCGLASDKTGKRCCDTPCPDGCNVTNLPSAALTAVGHLNASTPGETSFDNIKAQIAYDDKGRPMAANIAWYASGAHVVVIGGFADATSSAQESITICDPDGTTTTMSYANFPRLYKTGGTWNYSYTTKP